MCTSSPERTPKLELTTERPSTGECWIPPKKIYPMSKGKGEAPEDGRKGKTVFRIKPHTHQTHSEGSDKTLCTPGDPTDTEPDLPLRV